MHQPRPYGLFGPPLSEEDDVTVDALVRNLTNIKRAGSLDALKLVRALPGGGVAVAQDMGGVLKVVVHAPQEQSQKDASPEDASEFGYRGVPMLFSGVVDRAVFQGDQGVQITLTEQARRRVSNYREPVARTQTLQRFSIEYGDRHAEFRPDPSGAWKHSQYVQLRPTWFSGNMATLVQIVGGYGRQDFSRLPDNNIERANMAIPAKFAAMIEAQLKPGVLPGYVGRPPIDGQIRFDYKFHETHGVAFDTDKKPWLIRINIRGVYAMPLPVVPATTTPAFREFVEEKGDAELLWILDRFGAMPSGEGFPETSEAFEAWRRAGVVIKVCDVADFYTRHMGYSSAMGWSFNDEGTEAVNTCYEFDSGDGLQNGRTYKLSLRLSAMEDPPHWEPLESHHQEVLNNYLAGVVSHSKPGIRRTALLFKLRRVGQSELLARAGGSADVRWADEANYWDNYESLPIATHGGNVSMIAEGKVWARGFPRTHPQIKFPEPLGGAQYGCLSHDFGQLEGFPPVPSGHIVLCDTIMHAYFIGNDLKVCKYFLDQRVFMDEGTDNYDDCMQVGSWERIAHSGTLSLFGKFYTSDFDEREAYAPITTVTKIVGKDLGYDTVPFFEFDHFFAMPGTLWRHRYFQHDTEVTETEGHGKTVALCVPYFARNAVMHAYKETTTGAKMTKSRSLYGTRDPNSYRYWTYDFVWAWVGGSTVGNMGYVSKVSPVPGDGNPVWVTGYNYFPGPCTDFADNGDWLGGLPQDITWLVHPESNHWQHSGGGGAPTIKTFSETNTEAGKEESRLDISFNLAPQKINDEPRVGFFTMSPDEAVGVFYTDAVKIVAGDAVYSNCAEADPDASKLRKRWGFTRLADHKAAHHFIGVINE